MKIVSVTSMQRAAHVLGVVERDLDFDVRRHFLADLLEPPPQLIDDLDLIRARLLLEVQPRDRHAAHLERAALVLRAQLRIADVAKAHDAVVACA